MPAIDEEFRSFVQSRALPGVPMEKGRVSEEMDFAETPVRLFYQRSNANTDVETNRATGLRETVFDVEVGSLDDDLAQPAAALVKDLCNGYQGMMGSTWVQGVFVSDHTDSYQPRLLDADVGIYGATFQVQVIQ